METPENAFLTHRCLHTVTSRHLGRGQASVVGVGQKDDWGDIRWFHWVVVLVVVGYRDLTPDLGDGDKSGTDNKTLTSRGGLHRHPTPAT